MNVRHLLITNLSYKTDLNYSIQINCWLLKAIGAWPRLFLNSRLKIVLSNALVILWYIFFLLVVVPCTLQVLYEEDDLQMKIKTLFPMTTWFVVAGKYSCILMHGRGIYRCIKHIENDWRNVDSFSNREIMLNKAKIGRYITGSCALWIFMGAISYIVNTAVNSSINHGNGTILVKLLPFPFYGKLIDATISPFYELVFGIQIIFSMIAGTVIVNTIGLAMIFMVHASGQLKILKCLLHNLVRGQEKADTIYERFSRIIQHHLRVLRFIDYIENVLNQICFIEFLGSIFLMCLVGYSIIREWEQKEVKNLISYLMLFVSSAINILIFCVMGEVLSDQCKEIGETAYMINWYNLPGRSALDLTLIILISNSSIKITAGKLIKLSIATFSDVVKTAMVYLNILRTMTSR